MTRYLRVFVASGLLLAPAALRAQLAPGTLLWESNFSEVTPGTSNLSDTRLVDGGLQILAFQGVARWLFSRGMMAGDYRLSVTAQHRGGATDVGFGLVFGRPSRDANTWMSFDITADGRVRYSPTAGGERMQTLRPVGVNLGQGAANVLTVEVRGGLVYGYINGNHVGTWPAEGGGAGFAGVRVSQNVTAHFSSLRAEQLTAAALPMGANPVAVPLPGAAAALLWARDFSGWSVADDENARSEYVDGGLLVQSRNGMTRWFLTEGVVPSIVRITTSVQWRGGQSSSGFGLVFGRPSQDIRQWARVDLVPEGRVMFGPPGQTANMQSVPAPALRTGYGDWNELAVEIRGSTVMCYVNGVHTCSFTADRDLTGLVGVVASRGVTVMFRGFRVERL